MINSWNGLLAATRTEAAFRQEIALLLIAVPAAFLLTQEAWKRVALIGVVFLAMIVELLNTSIEKLADRVTLEHDVRIGRVKDMGSAAVGLTLLVILFVWLLVLSEHF